MRIWWSKCSLQGLILSTTFITSNSIHANHQVFVQTVFQRQCRLQQSCLQHQERNLQRRMWIKQCHDLLGSWWLYVLGISSNLKSFNNLDSSFLNLLYCVKVAKENGTTLHPAGLFIVRYHSLYRKYILRNHDFSYINLALHT